MSIPERIKIFAKECYGSTKNLADLIGENDIYRYTQKEISPGYAKLYKLYEAGLSLNWLISGDGSMYATNEKGMELKRENEENVFDSDEIKVNYLEEWIKDNFDSLINFAAIIEEDIIIINDILYNDYSIPMDILLKLEWFGCNLTWLSTGMGDEYAENENGETLRRMKKLKSENGQLPRLAMKRYEIKKINIINN